MRGGVELRLFRAVVGVVLVVPAAVGLVGGFLGIPALARLLQVEPATLPPSLHSGLRAVCMMFFTAVPLVLWSLRAMKDRAGAFRIVVGCAFGAGVARLTGCLVDGWPGPVPIGLLGVELGLMPVLLLWHGRLLRLHPA